ncbi:MAG: radical SAM protein [Promethearchaeota archaeon]
MKEKFLTKLEEHKAKFESFNETEVAKAPKLITQIHILDGCNLRCKHCYVGDRRFDPEDPLPLNEVIRRIQILKDFQIRHGFTGHTMNISGGEPTIHPDILEIIKEIRMPVVILFKLVWRAQKKLTTI